MFNKNHVKFCYGTVVHFGELKVCDKRGKIQDSQVFSTKIMETLKIEVPRGIPKSGRVWKVPKSRFKSMIAVTPLKTPFKKAMEERQERKRVQELQKQIDSEKKAALEAKRKRCEANRRKREENERKGEVVSVIKNPAKIKRMKKKQLRNIKKRDVTVVDNS